MRAYCNYRQDDWEGLLAAAEFAYNHSESATTKVKPFMAKYAFNPSIDFERLAVKASGPDLLQDIAEVQDFVKQEMKLAQARYEQFADVRRTPAEVFEKRIWSGFQRITSRRTDS